MSFSNPFRKKEVNYDELEGAAAEAARSALKGEHQWKCQVLPNVCVKHGVPLTAYTLTIQAPSESEGGFAIATFAGGCFWGPELAFQRVPGVVGTSVGYTQGKQDRPTYGEVCSGSTGHTEATQVFYDPSEVDYADLLRVFFDFINPTQENGQGADRGSQYRTGVYYHTEEQREVARAVFQQLKERYSRPIATELKKAEVYWPAEPYHQQYLAKGGRYGQPQSAEKGATETIRCYG